MGRYIVKLNDYYFEFSTIVDAPVSFGMSLTAFKKYYLLEYGQHNYKKLEERLSRVEKYGSSSVPNEAAEEILSCNRAGPKEDCLTTDEIYKAYCLMEPIRDGWKPL